MFHERVKRSKLFVKVRFRSIPLDQGEQQPGVGIGRRRGRKRHEETSDELQTRGIAVNQGQKVKTGEGSQRTGRNQRAGRDILDGTGRQERI